MSFGAWFRSTEPRIPGGHGCKAMELHLGGQLYWEYDILILVFGGPWPCHGYPSCNQAPLKNAVPRRFLIQSYSRSPLCKIRLLVFLSIPQNGIMLQKCFSPPTTSLTITLTRTESKTAINS